MRILRRLVLATAAVGVLAGGLGAPAVAEDAEPAPVPDDPTGRWNLIQIPAGCPNPGLPDVVFTGTLVASDARIGRFQVDQVRAGSIDQFALGGLVDVRFGSVEQPDNPQRFLHHDEQYLIGAKYDGTWRSLRSQLRAPQPLFGGDQVIGAAEIERTCPLIPDPLQVLHLDGSSIDTSVLAPMSTDKPRLWQALLVPPAVAMAALFALAAIRWMFTGVGKGVVSMSRRPAIAGPSPPPGRGPRSRSSARPAPPVRPAAARDGVSSPPRDRRPPPPRTPSRR